MFKTITQRQDDLNIKNPSFQTFLQVAELRRYRRFLDKKLKAQALKDRKQRTLDKVKIIPPNYQEGLKNYNPQKYQEKTNKKISLHVPNCTRSEGSKCLPKLPARQKTDFLANKWSLSYRKDETNSFACLSQPKSYMTLEHNSPPKIKMTKMRKIHTEQSNIQFLKQL